MADLEDTLAKVFFGGAGIALSLSALGLGGILGYNMTKELHDGIYGQAGFMDYTGVLLVSGPVLVTGGLGLLVSSVALFRKN